MSPPGDGLADLKQVVALGERLSAATDEETLAATCCGVVQRGFGVQATFFVTDGVGVSEGVALDEADLAALRAHALEAFRPGDAIAFLPTASLPERLQRCCAASPDGGLLAAPLRVQQDVAGGLFVVPSPGDGARVRTMLQAAAQQASAFLAGLRLIGEIRHQAREVETLLERRTRELRTIETHLIVNDRLAAIGTLAAGIGHEIANPLSSVVLNNRALAMRLARAEVPAGVLSETQRLLAENDEALDRIRSIVTELRTFARRDDGVQGVVDLRTVIESATRLARAPLRNIDVKLSLTDAGFVVGSAGRLGQVFLNLFVNAAQALGESRHSSIEVSAAQVAAPSGTGSEIVISVADNGPGIAAEHLPRIFDLYFTTKPHGEGTGLGLAIAHDIVARHGGRIEVESTVGGGATFRLYFPQHTGLASREIVTPAVRPAIRRRSNPPTPTERPRLLIVDDEQAILRALGRELSAEFEVLTARSGDEAWEQASRTRCDVLLCDVNLIGENGLDVAARLAAADERLGSRVIYMTGGTLSEAARIVAHKEPARFVAKPFDLSALVKVLRAVSAS